MTFRSSGVDLDAGILHVRQNHHELHLHIMEQAVKLPVPAA